MFRKIVFALFILFISFSLIAQPAQKLWSVDCILFSRINELYKLASLAPPSTAGPWTTNELSQMVAFVYENKPLDSEAFNNLYRLVQEELNQESRFSVTNEVKINTSLEYNFELYAHSNTNDFTEEEDWNYGWIERAPILKIPLQISFSDIFASQVDIVAMQKLLDYKNNPIGKYSKTFWTNNNLPDFFFLDLLWPYHASGVAGGDFWKVQIGREQLSWGPGHTGNFMLTNHLPYHDHILLSLWSNKLKYTTTVIDFPSPEEMGTGTDTVAMFFAHRIEFTLFSKMRISLSESMMYQNDVLNLRYLNPLMIYHQYFIADKSNSLLTLEFQFNPIKNFTFYGQFCMDEMQILGESSTIPNAMGYQVGLEV
ncbi:MAG: hypothetical protein WC162_11415 [Sphaerochaetaceae bacterium]